MSTDNKDAVPAVTEAPAPAQPEQKAKRTKPKSRPERWNDAIASARDAHNACVNLADQLKEELANLSEAMGVIDDIREEYEEWQGNLPENLQASALGEKLEAVTALDVSSYTDLSLSDADSLDDVETCLDECENADLPRGFGKD